MVKKNRKKPLAYYFYGENKDSRATRWFCYMLFVMCAGGLYAVTQDFLPNPVAKKASHIAAACCATVLSIMFYYQVAKNSDLFLYGGRKDRLYSLMSLAALPFFIHFLTSMLFIHALCDIATRIIGKPETRIMQLETRYVRPGRYSGCSYRVQGDELTQRSHICISKTAFSHLAPSGTVRIIGVSSFLGMHVKRLEYPLCTRRAQTTSGAELVPASGPGIDSACQ